MKLQVLAVYFHLSTVPDFRFSSKVVNETELASGMGMEHTE